MLNPVTGTARPTKRRQNMTRTTAALFFAMVTSYGQWALGQQPTAGSVTEEASRLAAECRAQPSVQSDACVRRCEQTADRGSARDLEMCKVLHERNLGLVQSRIDLAERQAKADEQYRLEMEQRAASAAKRVVNWEDMKDPQAAAPSRAPATAPTNAADERMIDFFSRLAPGIGIRAAYEGREPPPTTTPQGTFICQEARERIMGCNWLLDLEGKVMNSGCPAFCSKSSPFCDVATFRGYDSGDEGVRAVCGEP
jgi:hypothetical protein